MAGPDPFHSVRLQASSVRNADHNRTLRRPAMFIAQAAGASVDQISVFNLNTLLTVPKYEIDQTVSC